MRPSLPAFIVGVSLAFSSTAHAQSGDAAAATELFRQGRDALEAKDYAKACPKLDESARLDPHVGTFISLAQCEEAIGRLARARSHWQRAVDLAHGIGDRREGFAAEAFAAVDARVPRLTLRRSADAPTTMVVRRDDVEMGAASFDVAIPVEVGSHTITASAVGYESKSVMVDLAEGEAKEAVVTIGAALPPPIETRVEPSRLPPSTQPRSTTVLRPLALGIGVAGVVALGVGGYFGIKALAARDQPAGACNPGCDASGSARNDALRDGNIATVAVIGGAALVAGGVVLWVVTRRDANQPGTGMRLAPSVSPRLTGIVVDGAF